MANTLASFITNTWVKTTWEAFSVIAQDPKFGEGAPRSKTYFDNGWMRIEDLAVSSAHGRAHSLLAAAINLYGAVKNLNYITFLSASFQKTKERECQPDLAYYVGRIIQYPPKDNQPVSIDTFGPPDLAIEVSEITLNDDFLNDDLGKKRLLYERLGVQEYWVVDVEAAEVIAFAIANGGSKQIKTSLVLPELDLSIVEAALTRSKTENDGAINRWLMQQFS